MRSYHLTNVSLTADISFFEIIRCGLSARIGYRKQPVQTHHLLIIEWPTLLHIYIYIYIMQRHKKEKIRDFRLEKRE